MSQDKTGNLYLPVSSTWFKSMQPAVKVQFVDLILVKNILNMDRRVDVTLAY